MFKSILVLESPWDTGSVKSTSVWPFVSEFAKIAKLDAYHQVFSDRASFIHWISCYNKENLHSPKLLYVAAHGIEGRIAGLRRDINGQTIIGALKKAKGIKYAHFGSCLFGSEDNLAALLNSAKHMQWAAGYDKTIDWIDSTVLDILLWRRIAFRDDTSTALKTHTLVKQLFTEIPGLSDSLGLRFIYRYKKKIFRLRNGIQRNV